MTKKCFYIIILLIALVKADVIQSTNQYVFRQIVSKAIEKAFAQNDFLKSMNLQLVGESNKINFLIEDEIFQFTQTRQISIFKDSSKIEMPRVEYQATSHSVDYTKIEKEKWARSISLELYLRIYSAENKILFSELTTHTHLDTVSQNFAKLEDQNLGYTVGTKKSKRIFEPIIVSFVTGVIVYIFYSYRSK